MKTLFLNDWSVRFSLKHSSTLIGMRSHLRLAAMAVPDPQVPRMAKIATNSELCSGAGLGKIVFGCLIGLPPATPKPA